MISSLSKLALRAKRVADKNRAEEQNAEEELRRKFFEWLDWVLSSKSIDKAVAYHFNIYEDSESIWSLELVGASKFSATDSDWACAELFATRTHPFKITHGGSWQEVLALFREFVNSYLETGAHREVLKAKAGVGIGFVDGDLELLYQKDSVNVSASEQNTNDEAIVGKNKTENSDGEMKIYQLWADHTYRAFETEDKNGYKAFCFEGEPVDNWSKVELFPSAHYTENGKAVGDVYPVEVSAVVVNAKCYQLIAPYIKGSVQVLCAKSRSEKLYVLNVTKVIDCLDKENSQLKLFPSSGRIMDIEKYVLYRDRLKDAFIFKIPEEVRTHPFVTEEFKNIIERNGIKGFNFVPVWKG